MAKTTRLPGGGHFTSFLSDIEKDIEKAETKRRKVAAIHVRKKIKKNISQRGPSSYKSPGSFPGYMSKNLIRGIGIKANVKAKGERMTIVGSRAPHSALIEFGHGDGRKKNKRPFFRRTFAEEQNEVEKILSETWF